MTGLTIVNFDVFVERDIVAAYLLHTDVDMPSEEDVLSVFPYGSDVEKYRIMGDYKSSIYFHPMTDDQLTDFNTLPWTQIGTRYTEDSTTAARLKWKSMETGHGQLDWEYVITPHDIDINESFNTIALYGIDPVTSEYYLLSYGYLESAISYSLVNSIHVQFTIQVEELSRGISVNLYAIYQDHSESTARDGLLAIHPNLSKYNLADVSYVTGRLGNYSSIRSNKLLSIGNPDYMSSISNFQVKSNTLFTKTSSYRLMQGYQNFNFPYTFIQYKLSTMNLTYEDYEVLQNTHLVIDNWYGPEIVITLPEVIVVISSWVEKFIVFYYLPSGNRLPTQDGVVINPIIHTYFHGLLVHTSDGSVLLSPPDNSVFNTTELTGYRVASVNSTIEFHDDKYVPANFELGNLIAIFNNSIDRYYLENLYSGESSIDISFPNLIDKYYSNNEDSEGIVQAKSLLDSELLTYLALSDKSPVATDIGFLVKETEGTTPKIKYYLNSIQTNKSRYHEIPYPEIDGVAVTSGHIFSSNRILYYQSDLSELEGTSYLLSYTVGSDATEWTSVTSYATPTAFRSLRGLQVEITTDGATIVRR